MISNSDGPTTRVLSNVGYCLVHVLNIDDRATLDYLKEAWSLQKYGRYNLYFVLLESAEELDSFSASNDTRFLLDFERLHFVSAPKAVSLHVA